MTVKYILEYYLRHDTLFKIIFQILSNIKIFAPSTYTNKQLKKIHDRSNLLYIFCTLNKFL